MEDLFCFIHSAVQMVIAMVSLLVIDLPLKIVSWVVLVTASVVIYIFYPITKRINRPNWVDKWITYAISCDDIITHYILKMWH